MMVQVARMKKYVVLVLGAFLFATNVNAWECEYGEAKAWVKLSNDTQWREAMVDGVTLKVHESFRVKVWVKTKVDVHALDIELYDPGVTKVFEVVEGPSKNGEHILKYDVPEGWTKTYEWTVRPTGEWTEGWAPLNLFIQFTKNMNDYKKIDKTIIHAYISSEEWKESENTNGEESNQGGSHGMPGFEFVALSIAVMLYIWRRRKVG